MTNDQRRIDEAPRGFLFSIGHWSLVIGHWSFRRFPMSASAAVASRPVAERALEVLRRSGNPFRNYFARNPDDDVCARYHVAELYAQQREQLLGVVDLYRYAPTTHSEVVPILGNKGAGKTHLLYSIKHGADGSWQMLVTPGVYQKDSDFLEYLLFQV